MAGVERCLSLSSEESGDVFAPDSRPLLWRKLWAYLTVLDLEWICLGSSHWDGLSGGESHVCETSPRFSLQEILIFHSGLHYFSQCSKITVKFSYQFMGPVASVPGELTLTVSYWICLCIQILPWWFNL